MHVLRLINTGRVLGSAGVGRKLVYRDGRFVQHSLLLPLLLRRTQVRMEPPLLPPTSTPSTSTPCTSTPPHHIPRHVPYLW